MRIKHKVKVYVDAQVPTDSIAFRNDGMSTVMLGHDMCDWTACPAVLLWGDVYHPCHAGTFIGEFSYDEID